MTVLSSSVGNVGNQPMKKSVFIKASRLRAGAAAGSVVDPERIKVTPNDQGVLVTPDLQPGPAVISWDTHNYHVTIPESTNPVSWWSVIALAVGVPPNTSEEAIAEALQIYLDANPIEGGGLSVEQIAAAADDPASPLGQTLAERYAPVSLADAVTGKVTKPSGGTAGQTLVRAPDGSITWGAAPGGTVTLPGLMTSATLKTSPTLKTSAEGTLGIGQQLADLAAQIAALESSGGGSSTLPYDAGSTSPYLLTSPTLTTIGA